MARRRENPLGFVQDQGWSYQERGTQIIVEVCPLCGKDKWHFYLNALEGLWDCKVCGERGNLYQLKERLGLVGTAGIASVGQALGAAPKKIPMDKIRRGHEALLKDPEAMRYLTQDRGWSEAIIRRCQLGLTEQEGVKWLAIPHFRQGKVLNIKWRSLPPAEKEFRREPGCPSILFNEDCLDRSAEVILCEGEPDAITLLDRGFENVTATTTGASTLAPAGFDRLAKVEKILLAYDSDPSGQKGARETAKRLGIEKCYRVQLPEGIHDVNDFFLKGGTAEDFRRLLAEVRPFDVETVASFVQALDRLAEDQITRTWDQIDETVPWPNVQKLVKRWRAGDLIVLSSPPDTGKTTFAIGVLLHWALRGHPALLYSLEMNLERLAEHIISAHYRIPIPDDGFPAEVIQRARLDFADVPLYLGHDPRHVDRKGIIDTLRQAAKRYGLRLIGFDHLHFLARSIDHRQEEVGIITKSFKLLASEVEIPILLIAQPRKIQPNQVMTGYDLKDSIDIYSDADQLIILFREQVAESKGSAAVTEAQEGVHEENKSPITLVRIGKGRYVASRDTLLWLEGERHYFRTLTPLEWEQRKTGRAVCAS
ncbi:MAG TPA: DnaB-like helicase C-terminal domain-containing protein [Candidatus Methylomirabilis sp.]